MDQSLVTVLAVAIPSGLAALGGIAAAYFQKLGKDKEIEANQRIRELDLKNKELEAEILKQKSQTVGTVIETIKANMPKCSELHAGIYQKIDGLQSLIVELFTVKSEEDGIKNKYNNILINSLKVFFDPGVKNFAMYKADAFFRFVMENKDTIYKSPDNFSNAMDMISSLYLSVKTEGYSLAGKEFTNIFYDKYHKESTFRYINDLRDLLDDKINNKASRFVDISMNYMQKFLSEMVQAYGAWKEQEIADLKHSHDEELRKDKV